MQVRLLGFRLKVEGVKTLSLASFAEHVAAQPYDPAAQEADDQRLFFIRDKAHADYYVGLVVTVKDQRVFCHLVEDGGNLLVKVNELAEDAKLMDFNFFVINKKTGAGVYQHYHQSCSLNAFGNLAARRFRAYRDSLIKTDTDALGADVSEEQIKAARKKHRAQLKWDMLVRKEKLAELIMELKRVKAFEWTLATPQVAAKEFAPLERFINAEKTRLTFAVGTPLDMISKSVGALVDTDAVKRGRVEGIDEDGLSKVLRVLENPENFGEYDFDDIAGRLNDLDLTNFEGAWIVGQLVNSCHEHGHVFEVEMRD